MSIASGSDGESPINDDHCPLDDRFFMAVHLGFSCDGCGIQNIEGPRYHCCECDNVDLCGTCHLNSCSAHPGHQFELIDAPVASVQDQDRVPWTPLTMDNFDEFSELNGANLGVCDALITSWLSEDSQRVDKNDNALQGASWVCAICMDGDVDVQDSRVKICADVGNRAHIFHRGCLHSWLAKSNTCPVCRRSGIICTSRDSADDEVTWFC